MAKLLGIDVGTSGCKAVLIDDAGRVLRQASAEYAISRPRPLWSEQCPEDWWTGVCTCLAAIDERRPDAVGLTGQMHGSVFLDQAGCVIRPAILWNDQRTAQECVEIEDAIGPDRLREITRNPPLTGFQAPKILWLRNHELSSYLRIHSILLPKDYIRLRLTGVLATDVSDASGTGLFDVGRRTWSDAVLGGLELDREWFPEAHESVARTCATLEGELAAGIPVVAGASDQAAGAVGTGAVEPGIVSVALGTSGVVFTSLATPSADPTGAAHTFCHANGAWHAMGVMLSCGGALRWLRDTLYSRAEYSAINDEAASAPPGCEGLTFLPYLAGERCPHNDPGASGAWAGLTLSHGRGHLARSVFEGVSFGLREALARLESMGAEVREIRVTGGGAKSPFWVQMLADVFQNPLSRVATDEGPAIGAAILAGVGVGIWPTVAEACRAAVHLHDPVAPAGVDYREAQDRYCRLYPAMRPWGTV